MVIKCVAAGLLGSAVAALLTMGCENSNGPEPYLCSHVYDSLLVMVRTDVGQDPLGPAIPLDSLSKLVVTDEGVQAIVNKPEYKNAKSMALIGKIIFK